MTTRTEELVNEINATNVKSSKHKLVQELINELISEDQLDDDTLNAFSVKSYPGKSSLFSYVMQVADNFINPRRVQPETNEPTIIVQEVKSNGKVGDQFIVSEDFQFLFGIKLKKETEFTLLSEPMEFTVGSRTFERV